LNTEISFRYENRCAVIVIIELPRISSKIEKEQIRFTVTRAVSGFYESSVFTLALSVVFISIFALFVARIERKEFERLPYVGVLVKRFL